MRDLYWLNDEQMARLQAYFPKSHGKPRVDDRRVLSGIVFVNHNGRRWRDAPSAYGPHKTLYNQWKRLTEDQIIGMLREHEAGVKTAELCRKHGISDATFYNWKAKYIAPGKPQQNGFVA